jgi:two-component system chemotaxis response regulator CheB
MMMKSVAHVYGPRCVGVLMTGMLTDGVLGMKAIKNAGGVTIAQDESSSLIFGMNKAAIEAGTVDVVAHVSIMADRIVDALLESPATQEPDEQLSILNPPKPERMSENWSNIRMQRPHTNLKRGNS